MTDESTTPATITCPYVYKTGRKCDGHIVRIEAYKADLSWDIADDGVWDFSFTLRSHYHLFCSEKSNHAGVRASDSEQMKSYKLPDALHPNIMK